MGTSWEQNAKMGRRIPSLKQLVPSQRWDQLLQTWDSASHFKVSRFVECPTNNLQMELAMGLSNVDILQTSSSLRRFDKNRNTNNQFTAVMTV